jgi:hypothetical protein
MLKSFEIGAAAISYIRAQLSDGQRLSQSVLDRVALDEGSVSTMLPETTPADALLRFSAGGVARRGETEPVVVQGIVEYLRAPACIVLLEDALVKRGDASLRRLSKGNFSTCGSEVYYFLGGHDNTPEVVRETIRFANSFRFFAVLGRLPLWLNGLRGGAEISPSDLEQIAGGADYLLVGAYDGEGDLVWARKPRV